MKFEKTFSFNCSFWKWSHPQLKFPVYAKSMLVWSAKNSGLWSNTNCKDGQNCNKSARNRSAASRSHWCTPQQCALSNPNMHKRPESSATSVSGKSLRLENLKPTLFGHDCKMIQHFYAESCPEIYHNIINHWISHGLSPPKKKRRNVLGFDSVW